MKLLDTPKLSLTSSLQCSNLIVGGCSFTYNFSDTDSSAWPCYLRDRCGFKKLLDCSVPGAGNYHISSAVQWCIEEQDPDPSDTVVVVMWSGNNRDSVISKPGLETQYPWKYNYTDQAMFFQQDNLGHLKSKESRAVENYLYVSSLYNYLQNRSIPFVFLDFIDRAIPNRSNDVAVDSYLPVKLQQRYRSMFAPVRNFYEYALRNDMLNADDFHPNNHCHLKWTDEVLVPYLVANGVK